MINPNYAAFAGPDVREAMRPRSDGHALDAHAARNRSELSPDFEKMKRAVSGEPNVSKRAEPTDG